MVEKIDGKQTSHHHQLNKYIYYVEEIVFAIDDDDLDESKDNTEVEQIFELLVLSFDTAPVGNKVTVVVEGSGFIIVVTNHLTVSAHQIDSERQSDQS